MEQLAVLLVTISLMIFAILWYKSKPSQNAPSLPPGPLSLPIVGYLPFLRPDIHNQFTEMANTYGPIFKVKLGSKLHVVINSTDLAKQVVRDHDETFSDRDQTIGTLVITSGGQDIVASNNNDNWRKLRKIFVHDMLSVKNLDASSSFRRDEVRKTIKYLYKKIGTPVDVREIAFSTEANVLRRMVWENSSNKGEDNRDFESELDKVVSNVVRLFGKVNISDMFPFLARFDLQGVEREMKAQHKMLDQVLNNIINERIESNSKMSKDGGEKETKKDFLQILLGHLDQKDGASLTMTQLKTTLLDVLVAGTDTTGATVEWTMASVMRDPRVMKKLKDELEEVVGLNNIVEESHLPKLKYLYAAVKETLRMYPVAPFLMPRKPKHEAVVGGYTIPKDCTIFLNVWSIQRDPKYWDNPLEYNPDRFLTNKFETNGSDMKFLPFGSGRRICAGVLLAEKMSMFILASLLHSFDWSLAKGEVHDLSETIGIALRKRKPLIAVASQRLPNESQYM